MTSQGELTPGQLRADIAGLLGVLPDSLDEEAPLLDQGLDSVRLMTLVERWRARGTAVGFAELAERPTLRDWSELIASRPTG